MTTFHFNQKSKYFDRPKNWYISNFFKIREQQNELFLKQDFFKKAINKVKKSLGNRISFLSYLYENNKNYFLAKVKDKEIKINIDKPFESLVAEDFKQLNLVLNEKLTQ